MSFGGYLLGSLGLIAALAAIGFGAVRLRGRLLPGWSGAPARLAEVVLSVSMLVVVLELVGVVGLYRPGWVLAASLAAGVGSGLLAGRGADRGGGPPSPPIAPIALGIAVAAVALVAAHWAMPTQVGLDIGMYLPNTTWHNAPFAARFVQEAQVGSLHFTEVLRLSVWFYPQNSELLHSAGILFLGSDLLSPLLNLGWMGLCLLAAWCFGRAYGLAAACLLALALVVDAELLLLYQPGDAKNDIMGLFFLLAAAAILVNAEAQQRAAGGEVPGRRLFGSWRIPTAVLIVAGLAAGVALGTKLNLLAPFGALTIGVVAVAAAGTRLRTALVWSGSALVTGGFWFARNLVESGNPLPWFDAGPLPGPEQLDIYIREPHTVVEYLTDRSVIVDWFIPGLEDSFGVLWPLALAAFVGGIVLAIWRAETPTLRMLGFVAAASGIAYLFTPLTAAGPLGEPTGFEVNVRYASPALALGALLLPLDPGLRREPWARYLLWGLAALLLVSAIPLWEIDDDVWQSRFLFGGALLTLLVLIPVGLALAARRGLGRRGVIAAVAAALVLAVGAGWMAADGYLDDRYQAESAPSDFPEGMRAVLDWFNQEEIEDARIAVVGGRPGFKQYILYGDDLSNHVQYLGQEGAHGSFRPIDSCEEWRQALNDGDYDFLVAGPDQRSQKDSPAEARWTEGDPAAEQLLEEDLTFVFRIDGDLDPAGCERGRGAARDEVAP